MSRWTDRVGFLPRFLTKPRKIGGRIDAWAAIGLLALGFVVFKLLPYFSRTAGADIAGDTAAVFPIIAAAACASVIAFVVLKANFWTPDCRTESELIDAAAQSWLHFVKYLAAALLDRSTFLLLFFWIFEASVGK